MTRQWRTRPRLRPQQLCAVAGRDVNTGLGSNVRRGDSRSARSHGPLRAPSSRVDIMAATWPARAQSGRVLLFPPMEIKERVLRRVTEWWGPRGGMAQFPFVIGNYDGKAACRSYAGPPDVQSPRSATGRGAFPCRGRSCYRPSFFDATESPDCESHQPGHHEEGDDNVADCFEVDPGEGTKNPCGGAKLRAQ